MNEIKQQNVEKSEKQNAVISGVKSNEYTPLENQREYIPDIEQDIQKKDKDSQANKKIKRGASIIMMLGVFALVVYFMVHTGVSVNKSPDAQKAIESRMPTALAVGTRLMDKDDNYVGGDLTVTHKSNMQDTKIHIWDYAAEDGDYVQVLVNGAPLGEPFMIRNKPAVFTVPTVGDVKVIGTRDGGGGITYAVHYDMNNTTYFNGMNQGGDNTYTLVRE